MPNTSVKLPGLRVYFWSLEHEPRHVHVTNGESEVIFKFTDPAGPLTLRENHGFPKREVNRIKRLLEPQVATLWGDWEAHFGSDDQTGF